MPDALGAVARQPVAHAPVGEAGHAAGLDLREAAVEREQRLRAAGARVVAGGVRLVHGALGRAHERAVVLVAGELERARELGAALGHEAPLVAERGRQRGDVVVVALAARLDLRLEPAAVAVRRARGHAVEAELGDLAPALAHHARDPHLRERQHRLQRLAAGEVLHARAQLAGRPLGHGHVGGHERLDLLAPHHAVRRRDQLLEREPHAVGRLAAAEVVPGGQKPAAGRVEERVGVAPLGARPRRRTRPATPSR